MKILSLAPEFYNKEKEVKAMRIKKATLFKLCLETIKVKR